MKTCLSGLLLLSLSVSLGASDAPPPPSQPAILAPDGNANFRTWTNAAGKKVEATFRGIENGNIFLQTRDGYVYRLSLDSLTPEDQKLAATLKPEGLGIPKDPGVAQAAAIIDKGVLMGLTKAGQQPNPLASDEQFVRRVYLDLAGRIPTREETLAFLNDTSSSKRANVIDTLINDDGFTSRMYNYMSDMLRITDDAQKSKFFTYQEWLKQQIADNRPWNLVVRDMMTADGKLLENGATGYLLRDRGMRLDNLSLTLSTFLGANVACAQCHDHPFADWTQRQFYEMAAFFGASDTYNRKGAGGSVLRTLREELGQQAFAQARRLMYANQLNIADGEKNDTTLPDDYKYLKDGKPGDAVKPKLIAWTKEDHRLRCYQNVETALKKADDDSHLREVFADWMTSPDNPRFAMTIANRLWKLAFGVGLKEPVTDLDDPNACSNPALLHHLANEMVRVKFDLRAFMRLLCNTQTYQREAVTRELAMGEPFYFPGPILRRMTAEQAWDSCVTLAIGDKVDHFKMKRADMYAQVMNLGSAEFSMEVIKEKLSAMQSMRQNTMFGDVPKGKGAKKKGKRAAMMREAGATNNEEEDYKTPETMGGLVLARASELRQPERDGHFLRMFGQSDRQIADSNSEEGSVPQVLMLMNGEAQEVLSSHQAMAVATAEKQETSQAQVESLYLSFFSRKPTAEELKSIYEDINGGLKPGDLAWVLFNSREFVFVQ